jgi:hypothetical protein
MSDVSGTDPAPAEPTQPEQASEPPLVGIVIHTEDPAEPAPEAPAPSDSPPPPEPAPEVPETPDEQNSAQ